MSFLLGNYGTQRGGGGGGAPAITTIPVGNTLYVDAIYGNDATGLTNRFDKPFLTIAAALTAAVSGDLINIHAGSYFIFSNLLKDGVNYYAEEGVFLNIFAIPFNGDTTAGGTTLTIPFYFMGYAKVVICSTALIVTRTNPLANLTIEMDNVNITNISNGIVLRDGTTHLIIRNNWTVAGRGFSMRDTGNLVAEIGGTCLTTFANVSNGNFWISNTSWTGTAYIKAKTFALGAGVVVGGNWQHIYLDQLIGGKLHVELEFLTDTTTNTQAMVQVGNPFALPDTTKTTVIVDIKEVSLNSRALWKVDGSVGTNFANVFVNGDEATTLNIGASVGVLKGMLNVSYRRVFVSDTMVVTGTGTLVLFNTVVNAQAFLGIIPITVFAGNLGLIGSFLVSSATAPQFNNIGGIVTSSGSGGSAGLIPTGFLRGEYNIQGTEYINAQIHIVGAAVTISDFLGLLIVNPAALLAVLVITMPSSPYDNQEVKISFGGTILVGGVVTALSILGNVGQTVLDGGVITTAIASDGYILKYQASTGLWRLY